ncbi:hypothetical protein D3C87_1156380 [compost metagenome]
MNFVLTIKNGNIQERKISIQINSGFSKIDVVYVQLNFPARRTFFIEVLSVENIFPTFDIGKIKSRHLSRRENILGVQGLSGNKLIVLQFVGVCGFDDFLRNGPT